jgi:hypothetical protein
MPGRSIPDRDERIRLTTSDDETETTMTTMTATSSNLLPRTGHAPGELLWGEAPRRQPIAPLILMAVLLLVVAAPSAMAGNGGSSNPLKLMRQTADATYRLTGLMAKSNKSLHAIDEHSSLLTGMQGSMGQISKATMGMQAKTEKLNTTLGKVGTAVSESEIKLGHTQAGLARTSSSMGSLRTNVAGSAASTKAIVKEFTLIDGAIGSMDANLKVAITKMAASAPLTTAFANNKTRLSVAGGDSKKYGVPNLAPDNRVMSVVLPMIHVMQDGGALPARKDRHEASNPIVGTALRLQVPDGTNVVAMVRPFDGFYGLPPENFFVQNRIYGF